MENFIINKNTLAIIPTYDGSKVININNTQKTLQKAKIIVDRSCKHYGSSLEGRICGTKYILGIGYKSPIIISETKKIIFFPTESINSDNCAWINLSAIDKYSQKTKKETSINMVNGEKLDLKISYGILDRQILRASRLENLFLARK